MVKLFAFGKAERKRNGQKAGENEQVIRRKIVLFSLKSRQCLEFCGDALTFERQIVPVFSAVPFGFAMFLRRAAPSVYISLLKCYNHIG